MISTLPELSNVGSMQVQPVVEANVSRIFFPNLNGLRFLAVLLVIVDHVEGFRSAFHLANYWHLPAIALLGQSGVDLFFVLSGFLITYLLLAEKHKLGSIDFKAFYLRRILRIWPLYYVVVALSLFVFPHIALLYFPDQTPYIAANLGMKALLYAVMLPNVAKELYAVVPYASQSWSIGVEEQFYIIWPVLVYYSRHYFRSFLLVAAVVIIATQLSWALTTPSRHILPINEVTTFVKQFLAFFRIQCMAVGGLFAIVLYQQQNRLLALLTSRPVQVAVWVLVPVAIVRGVQIPYFTHEMYAVLFGVLVLNLALTTSSLVSLRMPLLDYLGRISYGLYMWHPLAIVLAIKVVELFGSPSGLAGHVGVYGATMAISIGLAAASYKWLETPFLSLKKRFTRIQSGS